MKKERQFTTYEEAAKREIVPKEWLSGNEMNGLVRERYKKIVRSHYRTWYGLCYVSAGATLLGGANPFIIMQGFQTFITSLSVAWAIALVFIGISLVINHECNMHLYKIDDGKFLWKQDEVFDRTPDRYPKKTRIWTLSEKDSIVTLQAFFWFNKGDYVYLVKENKEDKNMEAFMY